MNLPPDCDSVIQALRARVRQEPDASAIVLIADDDTEEQVSAARLYAGATGFATVLRANDVEAGDIVLIALRHSLELLYAFWGALCRGLVPSIFPYSNPATFRRQLRALVEASGARAVIVDRAEADVVTEFLAGLDCRVIDGSEIIGRSRRAASSPPDPLPTGSQAAYVQYTSGTTGLSKGVVLSHRAILNLVSSFARALAVDSRDVSVSWLPLYHDYGLFAGLVMPVAVGIPAVLMSPFKWVRNPAAFFRAIHRHQATLCWAPNAAYSHAVRALSNRSMEGVSLKSLRAWVCGGEPVLYASQQAFLERFAPYGLREAALLAGYGMAENTLSATVARPGDRVPVDWIDRDALRDSGRALPGTPGSSKSKAIVSCGAPIDGASIRIVDERGAPLRERRIGEVAIRTDTLFEGYHRRPDLTAAVYVDGWYRTGDLGYLANGHLYVCGRQSDLIKLAGRGVYPQDLEEIGAELPEVRPGRVVVFGVPDARLGSEKLIMVCDLRPSVAEGEKSRIEQELRRRVYERLELSLAEVLLFTTGWVVKTGNGKMSRDANARKYQAMKKARNHDEVALSD